MVQNIKEILSETRMGIIWSEIWSRGIK